MLLIVFVCSNWLEAKISKQLGERPTYSLVVPPRLSRIEILTLANYTNHLSSVAISTSI